MSGTSDQGPNELAADMARLEAALDRIDHLAAGAVGSQGDRIPKPVQEQSTPVLRDSLDSMIARLRAAIDEA